ncbi:unnamed protein product, partial [Prorocentrum cordatum]
MPATDDGAAWTLLALVDFARGKMWTKDFDAAPAETDAASLSGVQSFLMDWVMSAVNHAPTAQWSDNGGQFQSVINAMVENAFGTAPVFIPPGHPASNGLTERMSAALGRLASSRAKLQSVTTALNNACRGRHPCPPEVLHRLLLPRRSTLTHQAVRQHMQAQEAAGAEIDRDSFLAAHTEMVEQMEVDGVPRELIDDHASQVGTLRGAISCRQLRIDIGNRLQWSRNASNKGMMFYTGDPDIRHKYEDGSFEIVGVAGQLLEVRRRGGDAVHREAAKGDQDSHCLFSAVAYGAKGIKGRVPSDQRLSAMGQARRKEVAAWIDNHREDCLDDVSVEDVLRAELEDDPHIEADDAEPEIPQFIRTPRCFGSGVAMRAMDKLYPVSIACYEQGARGLRVSRPAGSALLDGATSVHLRYMNGNHFDLFRSAPPVDTALGLDISGPSSGAAQSRKRPPPSGSTPAAKRRRLKGKQAAEPPRGTVLRTMASMTGPNSGGRTKVINLLKQQGFQAAGARRALQKLCDEKAVFPSQTRRPLHGST